MKSILGTAICIAAQVHETQTDMGGKAYILHPIRIMQRLRTDDEEIMAIAILHDVVEDSNDWTIESLRGAGMTDRICNALTCLTHLKADSYEDYIKKIGTNIDATRVKLEDLRDNSCITRLKGLNKKDFERMEKYHRAFVYLTGIMDAYRKSYG